MNEWKPTHKTKPGVEVRQMEYNEGCLIPVKVVPGMSSVLCSPKEFDALFEPIPKPVMVEIPYDVAQFLSGLAGISQHAREKIREGLKAVELETQATKGSV